MGNYSSKPTCPVCGSTETVYYCSNCNRYWCEDLGCPNAPSIVTGSYGNLKYSDIKECTICKRVGNKQHNN